MKRDGRIAVESEVQREPEKIVFRNQFPVTPGKPFGKITFQFGGQFFFGHRTRIKNCGAGSPVRSSLFFKNESLQRSHPPVRIGFLGILDRTQSVVQLFAPFARLAVVVNESMSGLRIVNAADR